MNNFKSILSLTVFVALVLMWTGCKEDDSANPAPQSTSKNISLHVHTKVGSEDFSLNTEYQINGQSVVFTDMQFYISNVTLTDHDGNSILNDVPGNGAYLVSSESEAFDIGTVDESSIHNVGFAVGLDSITNHMDPTMAEAPLDEAAMHWAWNPMSGYKFIKLEGVVDSDPLNIFVYHVAKDASYAVVPTTHIDQSISGDTELSMDVDLAQMLSGLVLENDGQLGDTPFNLEIVANIASGSPFSFD